MDAIGGFFSLELPLYKEYHNNAIRLNTGRNCLEYILKVRKYKKVYIPYYTCDVVMEPFEKTGTSYEFYHIDIHLELARDIKLNEGEALLYTNYYGLKQRYVEALAALYGKQLIVDNTQAFYAKPISGIDTFYTCRKFFGVPDGAYLYCDKELDEEIDQDYSYDRVAHLVKRIDLSAEDGFKDFRRVDDGLDNRPICKMSKLTQRMMQGIDYEKTAQRRRVNYQMLNETLGNDNHLDLHLEEDAVPMVYPYLVRVEGLREKLIEHRVFVARYWSNVMEWMTKDNLDYLLAYQMLPLPIDQRYGKDEMKLLTKIINYEKEKNSSFRG